MLLSALTYDLSPTPLDHTPHTNHHTSHRYLLETTVCGTPGFEKFAKAYVNMGYV